MLIIMDKNITNKEYEDYLKKNKKLTFINCNFGFHYDKNYKMCQGQDSFSLGEDYDSLLTFINCSIKLQSSITALISDMKGYNYRNYNIVNSNLHIESKKIILDGLCFSNCSIKSNKLSYIEGHDLYGSLTEINDIKELRLFQSDLNIEGETDKFFDYIYLNDSYLHIKDVDFANSVATNESVLKQEDFIYDI